MTAEPIARVASVNVGGARTKVWLGREETTAIVKEPVLGRIRATELGFVSDTQVNKDVHGGLEMALYTYASEDYTWWEVQLGRQLVPGQFGENLTTLGLDVNGALVGERWRIGSVLAEVAAPRIPCRTFAGRMNDPRWVKTFGAALRPGAYLRVLEPGEIGTGDAITIAHRPTHTLTIARYFEIYLFRHEDAAELLAVSAVGAKEREWAAQKCGK